MHYATEKSILDATCNGAGWPIRHNNDSVGSLARCDLPRSCVAICIVSAAREPQLLAWILQKDSRLRKRAQPKENNKPRIIYIYEYTRTERRLEYRQGQTETEVRSANR